MGEEGAADALASGGRVDVEGELDDAGVDGARVDGGDGRPPDDGAGGLASVWSVGERDPAVVGEFRGVEVCQVGVAVSKVALPVAIPAA